MLTSASPVTVIVGALSVMLLGSIVIVLAPTVSTICDPAVRQYFVPTLIV